MQRVGLLFLPVHTISQLGARFRGLGTRITVLFPGLQYDLSNAQIDLQATHYAVGAVFSALAFAFFISLFLGLIAVVRQFAFPLNVGLPFLSFVIVGGGLFMLHMYYPRILSKSVATKIDRGLVFASRDMLIQVSSGIPLYQTLANVADGDYGQVSVEFKKAVSEARSGTSLTTALENMAVRNQSKYIKKMAWQLVTAMRSGANLTKSLKGIIKLLVDYQLRQIKAYNAELNFIVLIYLLAAAVLPTVGTTILVIFSVFGVLGITPELYMGLIGLGVFVQIMIIGYVSVRRPKMYE
ncbi:MAG: type II secretion system F family protein [Candidatus Micrarchaeota archaeon]